MGGKEDGEGFISWSDVHELTRYLEAGYGGRFKFVMTVACPRGEQFLKQYWEIKWCDNELEERAISARILARFPSLRGQSLAAALLGLLYQADAVLSQEGLWAEPTIAAAPRRGRPPKS